MKTGEDWRDGEAMSVGKLVAGSFGPQHERLRSHHDEELLPIGVRVAFGARPAQVVAVMIRDAAWPVACGLVAGLAGTYYATRLIASFLFQTPPHDPVTLVAVVALVGAAACLAAWLPARRAASIDPVAALRAE
jgi:ABC-type lipoprotein release transport system permease subunit